MGSWANTAWTPQGMDAPRTPSVDAIVSATDKVIAAAATIRFELRPFLAKMGTVVLTSQDLRVAKDRMFGNPRVDHTVALSDIEASRFGPLLGVGPTWELTFRVTGRGVGTIYFHHPNSAEQIERRLREQAGRLQAEAADPALAQLHRGLAMAEAMPDGREGKDMSAAQVTQEARRIRSQYVSGDFASAWVRRVQLGYGVPTDGEQQDAFWLNAAAALAALKSGMRDHPMVAMCCGVAEQYVNYADPEQAAAASELNRLFYQ